MKITILTVLVIVLCYNNTYAQSWQWARDATCSGNSNTSISEFGSDGMLVTTSPSNDVYIACANFADSICLGPYTLKNSRFHLYGSPSMVVAKYDQSGNLLWAKGCSNGSAIALSITTDDSDNLLVFGNFITDSIAFDSHILINNHFFDTASWINYCYFLVKYKPSGDIAWAKQCGVPLNVFPIFKTIIYGGIATDGQNNIYITAPYADSTILIGTHTLKNSYSGDDFFVAKINPGGNVVWAKTFGGTGIDDVYGIAYHKDHIYITGGYSSSSINFGTTTLSYTGRLGAHGFAKDAFICELDTSGNPIWAKSSVGNALGKVIATDRDGCIYTGGDIDDSVVKFDTHTLLNPYNTGLYLIKHDSSGNILWANEFVNISSTTYGNSIYSITIDTANNVWFAGGLGQSGTGNIKLDSSTILNAPAGMDPILIASFNPRGNLLHHILLPTGSEDNYGIAADNLGNIYLCSDFLNIDPFILGNDSLHLYDGETENFFLAKYRYPPLDVKEETPPSNNINIYPNPANNKLLITYNNKIDKNVSICLYDLSGKLLYRSDVISVSTCILLNNIPSGTYICTIFNNDIIEKTSLVVIMK